MGLYNFQERFVPKILSGEKRQTIRAKRKHPDKPGDLMYLYVGLRHKGAERLMVAPCVRVEEIFIGKSGTVFIEGELLTPDEREQLARKDGFENFADMLKFWNGRLPFRGDMSHWNFAKRNPPSAGRRVE